MPESSTHNKRYNDNEKKILNGYLAELKRVGADGAISLKDIGRASGLPYRTVLDHYKNFSELERSNMNTAISIICNLADECRLAGNDCSKFLQELLFKMSQESVHFEIEYLRRNITVWERILIYARDILTKGWITYGKELDDVIFLRFCARFIGDMYLWGRKGFSIEELKAHHTFLLDLVKQSAKY